MKQTFNPCDECEYSYSKQNQESGMCKICEFKKILNLERKGKLLELPVAVGDTVYAYCSQFGLLEYTVDCIVVEESVIFQCSSYSEFECLDQIEPNISDFGKTVFLTREEAEAALK